MPAAAWKFRGSTRQPDAGRISGRRYTVRPRITGAVMTDQAALQDQLARIWAQALGVKAVAPDDNFFALGGHSLMAVKMIGAIQEQLTLDAELSLSDLIENPTLEGFAGRIAELAAPSEESGTL
jgi:acyl carrier protein